MSARAGAPALLWAWAGAASASRTAQAANVFRFAFQGDLKSLDPYSLKESFTEGMQQAAYEPLVNLDKNLKFAPGLAESWETPEPTRWRFHLRKNVMFHDDECFSGGKGRLVTADDVKYSFELLCRNPRYGLTAETARDTWLPMTRALPEYIETMLDTLIEHYGSVEAYLERDLGVDRAAIERLRDGLLE